MTSFTSTGQPFYLGFLFWHLWTTHTPRARVDTCAQVCTKLTHALSRKVLSLTKPKGKIYIKRNPSAIILQYYHHHHIALVAGISLTLSRHSSLSFIALGRCSGQHPYPHIAAECMFVLVILLLHGHVWGSIRVHLLWVRPCFSSSVLHVWFV